MLTTQEEAYGSGLVWYARIPKEVFGDVDDRSNHKMVTADAIDFSKEYNVYVLTLASAAYVSSCMLLKTLITSVGALFRFVLLDVR
jgi:hypothetical protein